MDTECQADRIIFWPECCELSDALKAVDLPKIIPPDCCYRLDNESLDIPESIIICHIDQPAIPDDVKTCVEAAIHRRTPLPGFMVDCDADRILVTTPRLAASSIPYLTGDGMVRFFAETASPEMYQEVAFTIESGLAVDIALERLVESRKKQGLHHFDIRKVTVGDRAIIDCFLNAGVGRRIGGEPSGHIIFHHNTGERHYLIDDPFVTYLLVLNQTRLLKSDLDSIMERIFSDVPEVYCARKPDSRAGIGLSHAEKSHLELWGNSIWGHLSLYAEAFIPEYIRQYGDMAGTVLEWGEPDIIEMSNHWVSLKMHHLEIPCDGWNMPLASIVFEKNQLIDAYLYLDRRQWAGPEVIRINFFAGITGSKLVHIGEGVFRNSGTSPKNSGYHKIWIRHPTTGALIPHGRIIHGLDQLGETSCRVHRRIC